jgi:hypothetical protein
MENLLKVLILGNEREKDSSRWISACEKSAGEIQYSIIDITRSDWLQNILKFKPDILLTKPGGLSTSFKQLYDERLMILIREMGFFCYPSLDEVLIYENKRYFSYWLQAHQIPHPETHVFYHKDEALDFIESSDLPLVGKVNIGASGSGVTLIKNRSQAREYIGRTFSGKGAARRTGPNIDKGGIIKRGFYYIFHPNEIAEKMTIYKTRSADVQRNFVIFQEYIPHDFEWRAVRIGDSFFVHKKLKMGEKASGSLLKNYDNPPESIFNFVREITDRFGFYSQAIDIFETNEGKFLVNEMQCIFGQSDPYQMMVNGKPGRYAYQNNLWIFEEGDFNSNESYDLRLKTALDLYRKNSK